MSFSKRFNPVWAVQTWPEKNFGLLARWRKLTMSVHWDEADMQPRAIHFRL
jgi:hypothetical protein